MIEFSDEKEGRASPIKAEVTTGEAVPLAEQIFGLWFKDMSLEDELFAGLEAAGMPDGYCDFWTDHYDASIEFGFVKQGFVMPQSALDYLWSIGFSRCWVNYTKERALYFSKDIPAPGVSHNAHGSKVADGTEQKRLESENASLRAKLDERDADAERYRWLRDHHGNNRVPHITQYPYCAAIDDVEHPYFPKVGLDAAVDAAMPFYPLARQSAQAASQPSNPET